MSGSAAIVTVGTELVEGLRLDTNTADVARALGLRGWRVAEAVSVGDDVDAISALLKRLTAVHGLVVVTGGLGPTHDDVTRQGASDALGLPLWPNAELERSLSRSIARHGHPDASAGVMAQALILEGADVIAPVTGTAPGMVVTTAAGTLALLPGPPTEMLPMLKLLVARWELVRAQPRELGIAGMSESDAQLVASEALAGADDVGFTILSRPGDIRILLLDEGAGVDGLETAAASVADALGDHCYSRDGSPLEAVVVREALGRGLTLAAAESCTGGMVASALTSMSGSSGAFQGGVVSYHNEIKSTLLGVPEGVIEQFGAVSEQVARAMAEGARERLSADLAVSITGIAGPGGGTAEKPVGLVWFGVASRERTIAEERRYPPGQREVIRLRATATALDLIRMELRRQ